MSRIADIAETPPGTRPSGGRRRRTYSSASSYQAHRTCVPRDPRPNICSTARSLQAKLPRAYPAGAVEGFWSEACPGPPAPLFSPPVTFAGTEGRSTAAGAALVPPADVVSLVFCCLLAILLLRTQLFAPKTCLAGHPRSAQSGHLRDLAQHSADLCEVSPQR